MTDAVILAIDQGTTGTTALLINQHLEVLGKFSQEYKQLYPHPSWVEHDPDAIWGSVQKAVEGCLKQAGISANAIEAIGITNQRETTCLFDKQGKPLHNWIVWQCRRTTEICEHLRNKGYAQLFQDKTGLVLDPYFSGTKLRWLFQNVPHAYERAKRGDALFGTIDTWLTYKLTQGMAHVTDTTNASRTLLMDLATCQWDSQLLEILDVPAACLPSIRSSSEVYGVTKGVGFLPDNIPIAGIAGDQQAALFGQACFTAGEAKVTYGTGCFMLMNTGNKLVRSQNGLLSSVAISLGNEVEYCLEGSAFIGGAAVQWLRDGLGIIHKASEVESLAQTVPDSGDVVFVPAFVGLGAPYWRPEARGVLRGLTRDTHKGHIARAVLEGIALQNRDILEAMQKDFGPMVALKVDGGACANNLLMQFQADVLGINCVRPKVIESTALGAAALAGLAVNVFSDKRAFLNAWQAERIFYPYMDHQKRQSILTKWARAVECA